MKRANAAGLKLSLPSLVLGDQHAAASSAANSSSLPPSSDAVAAGQESGHVQESGVLEPSSLSKSEWEGKESESNVAAGVPKPTREGESQSSRGSVWLRLFRRRRAGEDRRSIYNADSPLKPARSRKRNPIASSILASIPQFSNPRVYTYSNNMHQAGEPLDPLLTAQYDEPEIIQDFAEALMGDDAGMSETAESEVVIVEHSAAKGQVDAQTDADVEADAKDVQTEVKRAWRDKAPVICEGENMRLGRSNQNAEQNGKVLAQKGHALRERIFASQSGFVSGSPSSTPQRSSSSGAALSTKSVKKNTRNTRTNSELFLSAASDFAPIRERRGPSPSHSHHHQHHHHHSRSQSKSKSAKHSSHPKLHGIDNGSREGLLFTLLRFPLLLAIFLTIALEFSLYVLTRQVVNLVEYAIAWRGRKGELRKELRRAETWRDWKHWALEMDSFAGYEKWKERDASGLYDWILVKKVCNSLRVFRQKEEAEKLIGVLDLCVRNNFAGVEGFRLYSETFWGTKHLIENYVDEVEKGLEYIQRTDKLSLEAKRAFYRTAKKNLGTSALCLSGGASFGYYHCGVVRALLDANLLPKYVSGTSAGGLIAALTCTRHDSELKVLMVPELADRINACEESILTWGPRVWRIGARFEAKSFAQKAQFFTMGSTTFMEAYKRTGKVLNISVIPADRHSPVKLLNYVTSPDCVIWSALLASAAVPGILNPICLMQKTKSGRVIPWNWGHRFKDGSLRMDIPLQELQSLYNVNYPIVSQANPHVHLFFFAPKGMPGRPVAHRKGKGWRGGFFLSAAEHVLKLHLSMNFKVIRDLDLMPKLLGQDWSSTFLQAFSGAVTIWPKTRAWDWLRLLSDPDRQELKRMIHVGQSVTFPKLHMIENRVRLERAVEQGRKACRAALKARDRVNGSGGDAGGNAARGGGGRGVSTSGGEPLPADANLAGGGPSTGQMTDTDGEEFSFFALQRSASSKDRLKELRRRRSKEQQETDSCGAASSADGHGHGHRNANGDARDRTSHPGTSASTPGTDGLPGVDCVPAEIGSRNMPFGKAGKQQACRRAARSNLGLSIEIGASTDDGEGLEAGFAAAAGEEGEEEEEPLTAADLTPHRRRMRRAGTHGDAGRCKVGAIRSGRRLSGSSSSRRISAAVTAAGGHTCYADRGSISAGGSVIWQDQDQLAGRGDGEDRESDSDSSSSANDAEDPRPAGAGILEEC